MTELRLLFPIEICSTERLHGTSVIRSKVGMRATYRVGSTLKYRCERGHILEMEDGTVDRVMTRRCTTSANWDGHRRRELSLDGPLRSGPGGLTAGSC